MRLTLQPSDELGRLLDRNTADFTAALNVYARALLDGKHLEPYFEEIHRLIWQTQALADLYGRRRVRLYARNLERRASYADATPIVPNVPFEQAIADLVAREPILATTAPLVQAVYERHGFTLARATEVQVVQQVRDMLAQAIRTGSKVDRVTWVMEGMGDFDRAYGETVYRNAVTNAHVGGTFREVEEPGIDAVIGGLMYVVTEDSQTRPNHRAAEGLVAAPRDPVWHQCAPPNGHRCRCGLNLVDWVTLEDRYGWKRGRIPPRASVPPGFHRDPGFRGGRPDVSIYGG